MTQQDRRCGTCRWFSPAHKYKTAACLWAPNQPTPIWFLELDAEVTADQGTTCPAWEARDANPG